MKLQLGIIATIILVMMISSTAYGETELTLDEVTENFGALFPVYDFAGEPRLGIGMIYLCELTIKATGEKHEHLIRYIQKIEGRAFLITVLAFQNTFFSPFRFSIVQANKQYNAKSRDILNLDNFEPGRIYKDVSIGGMIIFPSSINMTKPMRIYYDDAFVEFMIPEKYHDVL